MQLAVQGESVNIIYVADYVNLVANGLISNEETIANNPELVQRFVDATLRGLADTFSPLDAVSGPDVAAGLRRAADAAYEAVLRPLEGTILTVIRAAAEAADAEVFAPGKNGVNLQVHGRGC